MIQRFSQAYLFTFVVLAGLTAGACKRSASKPASGTAATAAAAGSAGASPSTAKLDPALRSQTLVQLVFSLAKAPKDRAGRPRWVGCQLHVLRAEGKAPRVALDLGDARRRAFYPRTSDYGRRPMIFPYAGPPKGLLLEFHSNLPAPAKLLRRPGVWGQRNHHSALPPIPPRGFAFSCVLRRGPKGPGTAVDGIFVKGRPRISGSRHITPADVRPDKMQAYLRRLLL